MLLGSQNVFPFVLCISPFICEYWPSFPPVLDLWVRSTFRAVLHDNCNSRISALCPVNMTHIWWKAVVSCNNCWKWNRVDSDHTSPPIYSVPPIGVITQSSTSRGDKSGSCYLISSVAIYRPITAPGHLLDSFRLFSGLVFLSSGLRSLSSVLLL